MDKRFTSNPLPDPSVEPGSDTTENSKPSHETQHMRKINKTKILKTATELKKRISSKKVALQLSVSHGKRVFEGG
jgi:hypothetical protein